MSVRTAVIAYSAVIITMLGEIRLLDAVRKAVTSAARESRHESCQVAILFSSASLCVPQTWFSADC